MMNNLFEKFGIYDFMGIFGPGSMFVLYFICTYIYINKIDIFYLLQKFQCDYSILFIFIFCILSYFCGVVFHEIGKGISDFKKPFDFNTLLKLKSKSFLVFKKQLAKMALSIDEKKYKNENPNVYDALSYIRKKDNEKIPIIDKSRSIYGFSRGVLIGIVIHNLLLIIYALTFKNIANIVGFIIFDLVLFVIFLSRTLRYKYIWVEKTFMFYDSLIK